MHYVLVFLTLVCVNVSTWSFQGGGKINVLSAEGVERGKYVPEWTPLLTLEGFERAMSAPPEEGVLILDFHGSTLPDGRHEAIIDDQVVRFEEKDIPEGVYIASCRHPLGVSLEAASKYVFEEVEERNENGGFLAPKGHVLRISQSQLFNYWSYRPYKYWLHAVVTAVTSLLLLLFYWNKEPVLVGDVHARLWLVIKAMALGLFKKRKVLFAGDLLDGPKSSRKDEGLTPDWSEKLIGLRSALCVKFVRWCPWADSILGNHEVYPLWFGESHVSLASAWGQAHCSLTSARLWREWKAIEFFLTKGDLRWLRSRPLFVQGRGWTLAHAKVPLGGLTGIDPFIKKGPTPWQLQVVDGTKGWKPPNFPVNNSNSLLYVGHTPISKVGGRAVWHDSLFLLDWGAKKGGTAAWVVAGRKDPKPL